MDMTIERLFAWNSKPTKNTTRNVVIKGIEKSFTFFEGYITQLTLMIDGLSKRFNMKNKS